MSGQMPAENGRITGDLNWDGLHRPAIFYAVATTFCGLFLSVLDGTICNVALPTMAVELGVSPSDSIWIINAFQLVIMMLLLPFASLGELIGYKQVYLIGVAAFTAGSLLCAVSGTFRFLVASRVVQGVGAAMIMSVNTSLIRLIYPRKHLGKGVGLNATVVAIASVAGPSLAAAILSVATWEWIFAINLPIGVATFILARKYLPDNPTKVVGRKFNWRDTILNACTFGLMIGCIEAYSHGMDWHEVAIALAVFFLVAFIYVRIQLREKYPMLPFDLLRIPIFSMSVGTSIISFTAQQLIMVSLPFMLMHNFGYDAAGTGLLMTASPLVIMFVAPVAGWLIGRIHPGILGCIGISLIAVSCFSFAFGGEHISRTGVVLRLMCFGAGFGLFQSPNNHILLSSPPPHRTGSASGMLASARLIGQTSGAALVAMMFNFFGLRAPHASMLLGGVLAVFGALLSVMRLGRKNMTRITGFIAGTILACTFFSAVPAEAYTERNIITSAIDTMEIDISHVTGGEWFPYPEYSDRKGWTALFGDSAAHVVAEGEKYLGYQWKTIPATAYLEYERTGDRQIMEKPYDENRRALNVLALAELAEGKGRFIDDIANGLWYSTQMTSWVLSAHQPKQSSGRALPDGREQIIDLGSGGLGALVSMVLYLFGDEMDSLDPSISAAVRYAVRRNIILPYLDESLHEAHWWLAEDWKPGQIINNWNPWCNSNVLLCALLTEKDPAILEKVIRYSALSADRYLNYVKEDGACEEGPAYWEHAAGKLYDYLKILSDATEGKTACLLRNPVVRSMGEYISRSYIGNGNVVNFADAVARMTPDKSLVYRFGIDCGSREMADFALYLLYDGQSFLHPPVTLGNDVWRSLESVRSRGALAAAADSLNALCGLAGFPAPEYGDNPAVPQLLASLREDVPACIWYPETEFAYMRNGSGWFLAAKGGYNNESHNHNDIGTFILYVNDEPVFVDAGVGTYTRKTFSHERYTIWSMQSSWHNLPEINGCAQIFGDEFRASGTRCDIRRRMFSTDISGAYSDASQCSSWVRSYRLGDSFLEISDEFALDARVAADTVNFLVHGNVTIGENRREVLVEAGKVTVSLHYPSSLKPSVTYRPTDDPRMRAVWGDRLARISFVSAPDAPKDGKYVFRVTLAGN